MTWAEGDVVAWWNDGRLAFAVVGGEEKRRLRLIPAAGREVRVAPGRLAFRVQTGGEVPGRDEASVARAAARAGAAERAALARAAEIDVALVWDLAVAEESATGLDALAAIALDADDGAARAALVTAFLDDGIHFVRKGDHWEARSREAVAALIHEREIAAHRETRRSRAVQVLVEAARGAAVDGVEDNDVLRRFLAALEEQAVFDLDASDAARTLAEEALRLSGLRFERPAEGAFRLLRAFGRWEHDDVNLQIERYRFRTRFPDEVLAAARRASERGFDRDGREDLTDRYVVTIDAAATREVDDGLSIEPIADGGWRLGVHIADPSAFVDLDDPVDREALARGATLYFPDVKLTMLPAVLSEDAASLVEAVERPALSFLVDLAEDGRIVGRRVARTVVRASRRLTYDEADARVARGGDEDVDRCLGLLDAAAVAREGARLRDGALLLLTPDVDGRVGSDGTIDLERLAADSPARRIVTEAMIVAGEVAARTAIEAGVALIFRRQPEPERASDMTGRTFEDPVEVRRVRMGLRRGESGLAPGRHFALALDAYAQVTSPLRRFQDLANQRQLAAIVEGRPAPYDEVSLRPIAATTERAEIDGRRAERAAVRYWLLRHLEGRGPGEVEGTVVETGSRTVVRLDETLLEEPVAGGLAAAPGDRVRVRVAHVNPRADVLRLRVPGGLPTPPAANPTD